MRGIRNSFVIFLGVFQICIPGFSAGNAFSPDEIGELLGQLEMGSLQAVKDNDNAEVAQPRDRERARIMNRLLAIGEDAIDQIINKLNAKNTSRETEWDLAYLLGKFGNSKAVEPLIEKLRKTEDHWLIIVAASSLTVIGKPSADALIEYLKEQEVATKGGKIYYTADWLRVAAAARSIGEIGDRRGEKHIKSLLEVFFENTCDKAKGRWGATGYIQQDLINALVNLSSTESRDLFSKMAKNDKDIAWFAQNAIVRLQWASAGINPFDLEKPVRPLDPRRVYSKIYYGSEVKYVDMETREEIPCIVIKAGKGTKL